VARSNNPFARAAGSGTGGIGGTGGVGARDPWPPPALREQILFACQLRAQQESTLGAALPQLASHRPLVGSVGSQDLHYPPDPHASTSGRVGLDRLFDRCSAEVYRTLRTLVLDALPRSASAVWRALDALTRDAGVDAPRREAVLALCTYLRPERERAWPARVVRVVRVVRDRGTWVLAPFTSHAHLTDFPPPHGGPARITTVLDLSFGHPLAFRFRAGAAGGTVQEPEELQKLPVDADSSFPAGVPGPVGASADDAPGREALYDALAAGFLRTGARSCALHVPGVLACLLPPTPDIRAACAGLGIAIQELTADELRALYGAQALATVERIALGGPTSWDRALAGRTLPAAALAEGLDGYAERVLGYAPLRARRRRAREQGLDVLLAGCDPAERYPAL